MNLEELVSIYIRSAEYVFTKMEIVRPSPELRTDGILKVVGSARDYLRDAKYYREKEKFEVSLASVAYCEGLLDALKLLGTVRFEWPSTKNQREEHEE
jgi:FAD synthetase